MALTKKQWDALQMPQVQPDDAITTHHLRNLLLGGSLKNDDGSVSTVSTMQVNGLPEQQSGKPTLIPSIWDGKRLSQEDASRRAYLEQQFSGVQYPTAETHEVLREKDKTIHQNFGLDIETGSNPIYKKEKEEIMNQLLNQNPSGLLGQPPQQQAQPQAPVNQPIEQQGGLLKQDPKQEIGQNFKKQIQDHLVLREGNKEESYLDSLGILHAGIGHRLSKEEQQLYPKGTVVPEEIRNAWFEDDSAKSTKAAYDQAQELQAPSLIPALASVNFQLGTAWTEKFPTAYEHLKNGNYESAIQEIENTSEGSGKLSTWNKQTPVRVKDFVASIRELAQSKQRA